MVPTLFESTGLFIKNSYPFCHQGLLSGQLSPWSPPAPTGRFTHVIVLSFLLSKGVWAIVLSKQTLVIVISSHKQRYLMFLWSVPPASIDGIYKPSEEKCSALLLFEGNLTILKNKIKPSKFNTDLSQIGPLFSHPNFFPEACTQRKSHKVVLIIIHP